MSVQVSLFQKLRVETVDGEKISAIFHQTQAAKRRERHGGIS
jgi:predicted HD phosphohydrolase